MELHSFGHEVVGETVSSLFCVLPSDTRFGLHLLSLLVASVRVIPALSARGSRTFLDRFSAGAFAVSVVS